MTTIMKCDRCGEVYSEECTSLDLTLRERNELKKVHRYDLCPACTLDFETFMTAPQSEIYEEA